MDNQGVSKGCLRPHHLTRDCSPRPAHAKHRQFPSRREVEGEPVKIDHCLVPYVSTWLSKTPTSGPSPLDLQDSLQGEAFDVVASPTSDEHADSALLKSQKLLLSLSNLDLDLENKELDDDFQFVEADEEEEEPLIDEHSIGIDSDDSLLSASTNDDDSVTVPKDMMKLMLEMWEEIRVLKGRKEEDSKSVQPDVSHETRKPGCMRSGASTASTRSQSSSSLRRYQSTPSSVSRSIIMPSLVPCTPPATPRQAVAMARPMQGALCPPANQVHVCLQAPLIAPHTTAVCQPYRSVSMVQTVTVTTSWVVS